MLKRLGNIQEDYFAFKNSTITNNNIDEETSPHLPLRAPPEIVVQLTTSGSHENQLD